MNFSRAADELYVTQSAISKQIRMLETELGVKLFDRTTRKLELTVEGREYLDTISESFTAMRQATQRIRRSTEGASLSISVLPSLGIYWLMPRLNDFNHRYPEIKIHLTTSIEPVDFDHDKVDVAIRVGQLPGQESAEDGARIELHMTENWTGVAVEYLTDDILVPVCSPDYKRRSAPLEDPEDLRNAILIHNSTRGKAWPDWLAAIGKSKLDPPQNLAFGHFFLARTAAIEGQGVAILPDILVRDALDEGSLITPFPQKLKSRGAYYILFPKKTSSNMASRVFRQWLKECMNGSTAEAPEASLVSIEKR